MCPTAITIANLVASNERATQCKFFYMLVLVVGWIPISVFFVVVIGCVSFIYILVYYKLATIHSIHLHFIPFQQLSSSSSSNDCSMRRRVREIYDAFFFSTGNYSTLIFHVIRISTKNRSPVFV